MSDAANNTNAVDEAEATNRLIADGQPLITLGEAARRLPKIDGRKIPVGTIWRWCRFGLRGVVLEHVRVGNKICTSHEALTRFFATLTDLDRQTPPPGQRNFIPKRKPITSKRRLRALREADDVLARAGI